MTHLRKIHLSIYKLFLLSLGFLRWILWKGKNLLSYTSDVVSQSPQKSICVPSLSFKLNYILTPFVQLGKLFMSISDSFERLGKKSLMNQTESL